MKPISPKDRLALATALTDALWECGKDLDRPVKRMEFRGVNAKGNEVGQGGLCHAAMVGFLSSGIKRFTEAGEKLAGVKR